MGALRGERVPVSVESRTHAEWHLGGQCVQLCKRTAVSARQSYNARRGARQRAPLRRPPGQMANRWEDYSRGAGAVHATTQRRQRRVPLPYDTLPLDGRSHVLPQRG